MKTLTPKFKLRWATAKYLFWLGPVLILMGLSAGVVSGTWGSVPLGLLMAGIVILCFWLLVQARGLSGLWGQRSTQAGTNALLAVLAMLTILGLINFLGAKYPVRWDLTEQQFFSLAPQTQEVLRSLKQPLKVLVFEAQPDAANRTLLEQYRRQGSPNFSFELIDPQAEPGLAQKYKILNPGEVILETNQRTLPVDGSLTEANLTSAIARILSDRESKAYFIQGHGERSLEGGEEGLSLAAQELQNQKILVEPLNLVASKQIPADANLVVIAGPKRPFLPVEVKLLQDYSQRGGHLLLMLDPETKPGLDSLLKDWGVELDNRLVVDASGAGQLIGLGPAVPLVTVYGDSPITKDFAQGISFFPLAQAVQVKQRPDEQVTELLLTGDQSWAESDPDSPELRFDPKRDRRGPLVLGVQITRSLEPAKSDPNQPESAQKPGKQARLIVLGDSDFATDGPFNSQSLNRDLFLNAVTWLSDAEQTLSIRPKEATNRRLQLTAASGRFITLLGLILLPLAAFGTAGTLWWQRR